MSESPEIKTKWDWRFGPVPNRAWWMEILAAITWFIGLLILGTIMILIVANV